jgi:predicted phage terminase large subunit-like protein
LLHVSRERLTFPELKRKILRYAAHYRAKTVLIEDAGIGTTMVQMLKSEGVRVIGCRPEGCKIARMEGQSVLIESGSVLIPKTAPWLGGYLTELLSFPAGRHDDQVDSTSQFLVWANRPRPPSRILF